MDDKKNTGLKQFLKMFFYFLDKEDRKGFVFFVFILMIGGFLALLGVASVVPLLYILLSPEKVQNLPILQHLTYLQSVALSVALLIVFFWLRAIASILILRKQNAFLFGLTRKIQLKTYESYLSAAYTEHVKKNVSALISMLSIDINTVSYNIFSPVGIFLNESITSLILFIALTCWAPGFALIVIGGIVLVSQLYLKLFKKKAGKLGQFKTDNYNQLSRCITQSLGSFKETKLYQKETVFHDLAKSYATKISQADGFNITFSAGSRFLIESTAITLVLALLAFDVFSGDSSAKVMALISVFGVASVQLLPSMNRIVSALSNIRFGIPSLTKLYNESQLNKIKPFISSIKESATPLSFTSQLVLDKICFSYDNKPVLQDISLTIEKDKKIAFVGQSGAGKTTLADIILGLLTPDSGNLYVDDIQLTETNKSQWQALIGYIPQMIYIYDNDIRQNIAFGIPEQEIDDAKIQACLEMAALTEFVQALPENIYTKVGENGVQLSGGQRQRIGIARALYRNPSVLVMDEATAALDNRTEAEVTQALTNAGKNKTIITIAHRISTIQNYDVIYFLEKGKIIASGNYQALLSSCERFKDFVMVVDRKEV